METLIYVLMCFVALFCLFAMLVTIREMILDNTIRRQQMMSNMQAQTPAVAPAAPAEPAAPAVTEEAPAPAVEEVVAAPVETVCETVEEVEEDSNAVSFSQGTPATLEEKYLELSAELKGYYDDIVKYATLQEGSKRFKNARYEEYKVGKTRLVRLLIKRGTIVCEFLLTNDDFKHYISENKVSVKQAATVLKVTDEATVQAAKDSIDIVVRNIAEEKEYKKQQARERRRQRAQEAKEAAAE
ncbi:MAG: hypothetical protein II368_01070 [Clostridia bacterium]|nr:hypothetical protein [Clostridia bacterium]